MPSGHLSQMYGEFLPPVYQMPSSSRASAMNAGIFAVVIQMLLYLLDAFLGEDGQRRRAVRYKQRR